MACVGRGRSGRCGRRGAEGRARCAVCQRLRRRVASVAVSAHPRRGSGRGSDGGGPGRGSVKNDLYLWSCDCAPVPDGCRNVERLPGGRCLYWATINSDLNQTADEKVDVVA